MALVSRSPLPGSASYWAQGGIAAALAVGRLARAPRPGHAGRGPRRRPPERRAGAVRGVARPGARARGARRALRRATATARSPSGSREGTPRAASCTPAASATGRRITRQLSALAATHERIEVLERDHRHRAAVERRALRRASTATRDERRRSQIASRGTVLATGGAAALWARTTNPPGAVGVGLALAHAAGADLADLEFIQFHPTALVSDGPRDGFLDHRGGARRGRDAARRLRASASWTSWPRATRWRWRSRPSCARAARRSVSLDMRGVDIGALPQHRRGAGRGGDRPRPRHGARGARRALHDGRRGHRPRRPRLGRRALRRGRVRLHRPARGQPAGVELARGVLRARPARRGRAAARTSRCRPTPAHAGDAPAARAALARTRAPRCGATPGCAASADGLRGLAGDPYPLARLIAASCLAREESRGAHQRARLPGHRSRARRPARRGRRRRMRVRLEEWIVNRRAELFHEAMSSLASGVVVVTARRADGHPCGLAATSVASYSADPPSLLVVDRPRLALPRRPGRQRALRRAHPARRAGAGRPRVRRQGRRQVRRPRLALGRRRARASAARSPTCAAAARRTSSATTTRS